MRSFIVGGLVVLLVVIMASGVQSGGFKAGGLAEEKPVTQDIIEYEYYYPHIIIIPIYYNIWKHHHMQLCRNIRYLSTIFDYTHTYIFSFYLLIV